MLCGKYNSDVHDKHWNDFGVHLCHCASQWNLRAMFINWNCIMLMSII